MNSVRLDIFYIWTMQMYTKYVILCTLLMIPFGDGCRYGVQVPCGLFYGHLTKRMLTGRLIVAWVRPIV